MSDQEQSDIQRAWYQEHFAIQRSIKYHTRRQAFYDSWNNITNAVSILLGAGTVAASAHALRLADVLSVVFPIVITIFSTLNLVWGTTRRARLHNELYRRFIELERRMVSSSVVDAHACRIFRGERLAIEADEPPTMFVLRILCHNEVVRAHGAGEYFRVPLWQRCLAHLWRFADARFADAGFTPARRNVT